jgi:hypothetical protein
VGDQGRWSVYGVDLPGEILRRVYHDTAARVVSGER